MSYPAPRDRDLSVGARAADSFVTEFEQLVWELRRTRSPVRAGAARRLGTFGAEAVGPLCDALRDVNPQVRREAAIALGRIGSSKAVPALTAAMRAGVGREEARWQLGTAAITIAVAVYLWAAIAHGELSSANLAVGLAGMLSAAVSANMGSRNERRKRSAFVAVVEALGEIAQRQPVVELQGAMPELKTMSRDVLQETGEVRRASRETARRIELATERLKALPVPGTAAAPGAEVLPRPAAGAQRPAAHLPRVPEPPAGSG